MNEGMAGAVRRIEAGFRELADMMASPENLDLEVLYELIPRLERATVHKALIDGSFAHLADLHRAGRRVGSSKAIQYLMQELDISYAEANRRLDRGRELFGSVEGGDDDRRVQSDARYYPVSAEKRDAIAREMRKLRRDVEPGRMALLHDFLELGSRVPIDELIEQVRERVRAVNAEARQRVAAKQKEARKTAAEVDDEPSQAEPKEELEPEPVVEEENPYNHALEKAFFAISRPDENGGCRVSGYVPQDIAALLDQATNPRNTKLTNALVGSDLETDEQMAFGQKRMHLLVAACRNFVNSKTPNLAGVGTVVVSMTLEDLLNFSLDDVFPTNTGHLISPLGMVRLGDAGKDFFVIHDQHGNPLNVGAGNRTANFWQRIALLAKELVCSHPGCSRPANQCDVHHVQPFSDGGQTTMDNLTHLCWGHHPDNNDYRKRNSPFGWADRDPETGRTGYRRNHDSDLEFNETTAARRAAGARIRRRYSGRSGPPVGETHKAEGLFDVLV